MEALKKPLLFIIRDHVKVEISSYLENHNLHLNLYQLINYIALWRYVNPIKSMQNGSDRIQMEALKELFFSILQDHMEVETSYYLENHDFYINPYQLINYISLWRHVNPIKLMQNGLDHTQIEALCSARVSYILIYN